MENKRPRFEDTVDVLIKAYLNDTLEHGNCCACAVGNLIAHSNGYKYIESLSACTNIAWDHSILQTWYKDGIGVVESEQSLSTGYNRGELQKIEKAFEGVPIALEDDRMFNGLMAVVSVLAEIHGVDLETTENAKKLFVKA